MVITTMVLVLRWLCVCVCANVDDEDDDEGACVRVCVWAKYYLRQVVIPTVILSRNKCLPNLTK